MELSPEKQAKEALSILRKGLRIKSESMIDKALVLSDLIDWGAVTRDTFDRFFELIDKA